MNAQSSCPSCGAPRGAADRFCGSCGAVLKDAPAHTAVPAASAFKKTMLGTSAVAAREPVAPPIAEPASSAGHAKTVLGLSAPAAPPTAPTAEKTSAAKTPGAAVKAAGPSPNAQKTMLGMMAPIAASAPKPGTGPAQSGLGDQTPKQTVFGVSEEASAPNALPAASSPSVAAVGPSSGGAPKKPIQVAPTNRTMLGVAPEIVAMAKKELADATARGSVESPKAPSTSISSSADRDRPLEFTRPSAPSGSLAPAPRASFDEVPSSLVSSSSGLGRGALIVAALLLAAALSGIAFWLTSRAPELAVQVVNEAGTDFLQVDVPGSKAGTKVRFSGTEQPLEAGRARFALPADGLVVGDNALAIDVLAPNGDVDSAQVALHVAYRVRADLAALASNPPAIDVVVDAKPGTRVVLDGEALPLDAAGHGVRRTVVPPQTGSTYTLLARYRMEGEGSKLDGEVRVSLPVTMMQIDRPSPDSVTDQDAIEIAGGVSPQATVHVGDVAVGVTEGRFLHRAPLAKEGDYTFDVIARAPGQAPHQVPIRVRRVHDMTMAAASFVADPSLTYARIAQNPVIYRGQKVSLDGRVYNVEVQGGRSVIQLLVRDCPGAQRCSLWVDYGQATDATVDTWVRVLGTVAGEQQFRSKQGVVQNVPSVSAQYVLRLAR